MSARSNATHVVLRIRTDPERAELVAAEVWAAGASGLEERDEDGSRLLIVYAPRARGSAVSRAARQLAPDSVGPLEDVPAVEWSEAWKCGLEPIAISPRLVVRPPFASAELAAGQHEVVIDPGQAFGTGGHASTALALALIDATLARAPVRRFLDVGCGSGVLALAALRLGAARAIACDVDPVAVRDAAAQARANQLGGRVDLFTGSVEAVAPARCDAVAANLIRSEALPLLPALLAALAPGGWLVLSGWLREERTALERALADHGAALVDERVRRDPAGDEWLAVLTRRS